MHVRKRLVIFVNIFCKSSVPQFMLLFAQQSTQFAGRGSQDNMRRTRTRRIRVDIPFPVMSTARPPLVKHGYLGKRFFLPHFFQNNKSAYCQIKTPFCVSQHSGTTVSRYRGLELYCTRERKAVNKIWHVWRDLQYRLHLTWRILILQVQLGNVNDKKLGLITWV